MLQNRVLTLITVFLVTAQGCASSSAREFTADVHLWFNAFIPKDHPGVPGYIHRTKRGTFVFEAPLIQSCFETDNRLFDSSSSASARIKLEMDLHIQGREMTIVSPPTETVGKTHKVDCQSGVDLELARSARKDFTVGEIKKSDFKRVFFAQMAGANPFILGAPTIDMKASVEYDVMRRKIQVNSTVGNFPAFEVYYTLNGSAPLPVYRVMPYQDSTALSLVDLNLGINSRNVAGAIALQ